MAANSEQADENQFRGEESDPFVSEGYEHEETGKDGVVPKVEEEDSDEEMNDEEGDVYKIMSNVKVTINEKVEGIVNPLPDASKKKNVKFEDYEFEEVDMKEVAKEKAETDEIGVKEEDGLLTPKIEPANPDDMAPNLLTDIVLGFYGKQFLQKSNTEESKPILEQIELKCNYCLKQFSKRSALMCHVKDVHEKNGDFACGFCEKRFYRKSALIDHERKHTGEKPFVCIECGKAYDRKSYLNIHMQMHGERYPCGICEKTFSLKKNLGKHIKYVHEKVKNFCCETCSKTFGRSEHLKRHIEDMHENRGDYVHHCEKCGSSFRKEDQLKAHHRNVHDNEKNFVCDTCAKAFPIKASLDRHIADVHEQSGTNQCQFCEKRFYKPHALKIHERKHTQEKPFACGFCDKKYHRAMDKDAHERKHTGEKPFQCETCGVSFRSQALKRYHMKSHVEVLKQESEQFDPNVLNGLNSALQMMANQNTQSISSTIPAHSEEKPYQSEVSDVSFSSNEVKQDPINSHVDKSQGLKQDHMNTNEDRSHALKQDDKNHHEDRNQVLKQDHMNSHGDRSMASKQDHMNSPEDRNQALKQDHNNSHEDRTHVLKQDHKNSHVDRSQALKQDNKSSPEDKNQVPKQDHVGSHGERSLASEQEHMNPTADRGQALKQDNKNSHEDRNQVFKQDHMISYVDKGQAIKEDDKTSNVDRSKVLKLDHMNSHVDKSQALKDNHKNSNVDGSKVLKLDHMNSHVDRSQIVKQDHMTSFVDDLKHRHSQFDPSFLQPNFHNYFNLPIMNNHPSQPNRSPNILDTQEKQYTCESFKNQAMMQDHMKTYEEALKHRTAQYDPNVYSNLYSPHPILNRQTSPSTSHTEKPFQCEKDGESFRSQASKQFHMQSHAEVPKDRNAQFYPGFHQPNVYNPFSSALPLMKKQTALYRSSQSTTSAGERFQCDSFRSQAQAEKEYLTKSHPEVLKQGREHEQFVPSVVHPNVYNSLYSPQPRPSTDQ